MKIPKEYKGKETKLKCKRCENFVFEEVHKEIDYPYVCLNCNENMYGFEVEK